MPDEFNLGQGVRNIPQPPDPFEKLNTPNPVEQISPPLTVTPQPAPLPAMPNEPTPPPAPEVPKPQPDVPPRPQPSTPMPPEPAAPASPSASARPSRDGSQGGPTPPPPPPTASELRPPVPPVPTEEQYKSYSANFNLPKRRGKNPWIFIIPVVLVTLGLTGLGVFYFLSLQKSTGVREETPTLVLPPNGEDKSIFSSPPADVERSSVPSILPENGFGTLPPANLGSLSLAGLSLSGVIVANESTASALPEKANVFQVAEQNVASSAAYFSPQRPGVLPGLRALDPDNFNAQVSGQSLYSIKNSDLAVSELVAGQSLYGVVDKKTDWVKNKLKSLQIFNYYLIHYYPAGSKYWYPIYVFEGDGKLVGDPKTTLKMKLLLPALAQ